MPKHLRADQIAALSELAKTTDTGALVVLDDRKVVLEVGKTDRRFELMSVTKSVVSLAVGQLIDEKKLRLDQPVSDFIPAWKGTPKEAILVRHILEHTSGLDDKRTTEDIYASPDFVQFAIDSDLKNPPGKQFFYSNRAVNLIARIAEVASKKKLDVWTKEHLFAPLEISDFGWSTDPAGNPQVMAGIQMLPTDLAKLGQLVLDRGQACRTQIVSTDWIDASTRHYQEAGFNPHGLLWWLQPESTEFGFNAALFENWRATGVPEDFIQKLKPLEDKYFARGDFFQAIHTALTGKTNKPHDVDLTAWHEMTWKAGRPDGAVKQGPIRVISADGYGGQFVAIYPELGIVIARVRDVVGPDGAKEEKNFLNEATAILYPPPPKSAL